MILEGFLTRQDDRRFENALARARKAVRRPLSEGLTHARHIASERATQYGEIAAYVSSLNLKGLPVPEIALERMAEARDAMERAQDQVERAHAALRAA